MEDWKPLVASAMISRFDLSNGDEGEYFRKVSVIFAISIFTLPFLLLPIIILTRNPQFGVASLTLLLAFDLVPIIVTVFVARSFWSKSKVRVLVSDSKAANILGKGAIIAVLRRIQSLTSEFPAKERQPSILRSFLLFPNFPPVPEIQDRIAALDNQ